MLLLLTASLTPFLFPGQIGDIGVGLLGGFGDEDPGTRRLGIGDELLQVSLPVFPNLVLHGSDPGAQRLEIMAGEGVLPCEHIGIGEAVQGLLQLRGGESPVDLIFVLAGAFFAHGVCLWWCKIGPMGLIRPMRILKLHKIVGQTFNQKYMQFPRAVDAYGEDTLDIGGAAGTGDVGDEIARPQPVQVAQRRDRRLFVGDYFIGIEKDEMPLRQGGRQANRFFRALQNDRPGGGKAEVGPGHPGGRLRGGPAEIVPLHPAARIA
jgi:hypothetical protein